MIGLLLGALAGASGPPPVVGGAPVPPGGWPDAGALLMGDFFLCSAVLVAPDVVLSAAHCFGSPYAERRVVLGASDYSLDGVSIPVAEGFVHPDPFHTFDLAAFVLAEPAPMPPRVIATGCVIEDWLFEGAEVSIVGFGATDRFAVESTTVLHEARTVVHDPSCVDLATGCNADVSPGGELAAGGGDADSCVGDSGGPLYLHTPDGPRLVGITSRATQPTTTLCGDGGIYVRADAVLDWVEEVTGRDLARPACDQRPPKPFAEPIEVGAGGVGATVVQPRDPNPDDRHTFALAVPPARGVATVDASGRVSYLGWPAHALPEVVVVEVTDSTGLSAEVAIDVQRGPRVLPEPSGGCRHGPGPAGGAGLALLLVLLRRRGASSAE